eukprot:m.327781 g.327781  ORF g.327781 m.327781 type:complete len:343 (+) comp20421_c0_seq1:61-1089(+)
MMADGTNDVPPMLETTSTFKNRHDNEVFYRQWSRGGDEAKPKAFIVGIHGYGEHSGRYTWVAEQLTTLGVTFIMADNIGHGKSVPEQENLGKALLNYNDLVDTVEDLVKHCDAMQSHRKLPFFLFGHSYGGLQTFLTGLRLCNTDLGSRCRGIMLSGSAFRVAGNSLCPRPYNPFFRGIANLMCAVAPGLQSPGAPLSELTGSEEVNAAYQEDPLVFGGEINAYTGNQVVLGGMHARRDASNFYHSILVMHGGIDKICPKHGSEEIFKAVSSKDKRLRVYSGLKHEILNEPEGRKEVCERSHESCGCTQHRKTARKACDSILHKKTLDTLRTFCQRRVGNPN